MRFTLPPRQWYIPIAFAIVLVASAYLRIPVTIRAVLFAAIAGAQIAVLYQSLFATNRPGKVTYWRGVRYETKHNGPPTRLDIQAHILDIVIAVAALLIALSLGLRVIGL